MEQEITIHPFLQYKGRSVKRYLQRVDENYFSLKPDEKQIVAQIHIKHYGVEDDDSLVYLGAPLPGGKDQLCKDIFDTITADNKNMVNGNTNERVQPDPVTGEYPANSYPEYSFWLLVISNLPPGETIFSVMMDQMLLFCNRGDFDNY